MPNLRHPVQLHVSVDMDLFENGYSPLNAVNALNWESTCSVDTPNYPNYPARWCSASHRILHALLNVSLFMKPLLCIDDVPFEPPFLMGIFKSRHALARNQAPPGSSSEAS